MQYQLFTTFADNFNRADSGDLGADWDSGYTGGDAWQIVGNSVRATTASTLPYETVNAVIFPNDQWASAVITAVNNAKSSDLLSILLRSAVSPTRTNYDFQCRTTTSTRILRTIAGVQTVLVDIGPVAWAVNDVILAIANGNLLSMYRNNVLLCSASDNTITSGLVGMQGFIAAPVSDVQFDDFAAGVAVLSEVALDSDGVLWQPGAPGGVVQVQM